MRAELRIDPVNGPGYGIIEIFELSGIDHPALILRREPDNYTLGKAGWRQGNHQFDFINLEDVDNHLLVRVGPAVIDSLDMEDNYTIEVVGVGAAPLQKEKIYHSGEAAPLSPPADNPYENMRDNPFAAEKWDDQANINLDENETLRGVAAGPANTLPPRKRHGCLIASVIIFVIWLGGAWFLWAAAMKAPAPQDGGTKFNFSFIPEAGDDGEDEEKTEIRRTPENIENL